MLVLLLAGLLIGYGQLSDPISVPANGLMKAS